MPVPLKEEVFQSDTITLAVSINGKRRSEIEVPADADNAAILAAAKAEVASRLEGMAMVKEIVVPGKLVNLVVKPA